MDKHNVVEQFVEQFSEFKSLLLEHIEFNNELLPHIFSGECNDYFIRFLEEEDQKRLERLFAFFEAMVMNTLLNY